MTDAPQTPAGTPGDRAVFLITLLFRAVLAAAVILALTILLLPGPAFLAFSNYLQIVAAIAGALAFLFFWNLSGHKEAFLWAACGLGLWGIANIAWPISPGTRVSSWACGHSSSRAPSTLA